MRTRTPPRCTSWMPLPLLDVDLTALDNGAVAYVNTAVAQNYCTTIFPTAFNDAAAIISTIATTAIASSGQPQRPQ